jgi:hypothetical protein
MDGVREFPDISATGRHNPHFLRPAPEEKPCGLTLEKQLDDAECTSISRVLFGKVHSG